MLARILRPCLAVLLALACVPAWARSATALIARVVTPVAEMESVRVRLDWPAQASHGQLVLQASHVRATDLRYRFNDLTRPDVARCSARRARVGAAKG